MKKANFLFCILFSLFFISCEKDDNSGYTPPKEEEEEPENPIEPEEKNISLFYIDNITKDSAYYEAVKIGEYLWMNRNFNHHTETPVTREQLNKVLTEYRLNPNHFQIDPKVFSEYFGEYYSQAYIGHLNDHGIFYEGKERKLLLNKETNRPEWRLPSKADFRQLFAMCGDASEYAVRITLACKPGENPAAIAIPGTYWISTLNTNRYGFNCMPGGARHHNPDTWGTCFAEGDCPRYNNQRGDFYITFMAVRWHATDGAVSIHDYPDTQGPKLWHLQNIRWCRKLTDEELGYKLYIKVNNISNDEWASLKEQLKISENDFLSKVAEGKILSKNVDIKKTKLGEKAPDSYIELPKGYVRGFYVQFILDIDQPTKNISQIVDMAKHLK